MSDRVFFSLMAFLALALILLALAWPQGWGAPSWGPFREPLAQPAPAKPSEVPIS
jgi:hypothetical protein